MLIRQPLLSSKSKRRPAASSSIYFIPISEQQKQLISVLTTCNVNEFPGLISQIKGWQFEEQNGCLVQWIDVLNRVDAILEKCLREYPAIVLVWQRKLDEKKQTEDMVKGFKPLSLEHATRTVLSCLQFTLMLLENTVEKTLYASTEVSLVGSLFIFVYSCNKITLLCSTLATY